MRVLIVDDHRIVRLGLQGYLKLDPEIEVIGEAINGQEAVAEARKLLPDVVVMDLLMPVMNGFDATAAIKSEMPQVRVVILTSQIDESSILKALQAGADDYLIKVKDTDRLYASIKGA